MSKIGRMPIEVKAGVSVQVTEKAVSVNGPKGTFSFVLPQGILVRQEDTMLIVSQRIPGDDSTKPVFGLTRAMIANMVQGVSDGFEKKLELAGVGYRAQASGTGLSLSVGYSHPVQIAAPEGITLAVKDNVISVSGADKALVGEVAAKIRAVRPPEPYKGKGIKYMGEKIRRKAGKSAKAVGK